MTSNKEDDSSEDLLLEDFTLTTVDTTVVGTSGEGNVDDLSWTADEDWKFDFVEGLGLDVPRPEKFEEVENPTGSWTTDGDDLTKVQGCLSPRLDPEDPAPKHEAGPPFAVGDLVVIIWSRSDPMLGGEQGCVVDAHHPWYSLHMRDGRLRRVNANRSVLRPGSLKTEGETQLCSRLEEEGRMGSFGIHMDTQLKSLRRIAEEKQYAKVVKADDAAISVHLWDDRVPLPEASKAKSLQLLRQIGHKLFLRALR